jgi:prevent-host-death family protein
MVALEVTVRVTNISEAKASLSKLVEKVLQGEEVIIGKAGKPVARLVPYEHDPRPRDLSQGIWKGQVWMADDFDDLPEAMMRAFQRDDEPAP